MIDSPLALRNITRNIDKIDPESIEEYLKTDGYEALKKTLTMKPKEIVSIIRDSGLRGRGGAGYPTGLKWYFAANTQSDAKYVICNADEGEPGTFKDRILMEGDPFSLIEALTIAGYAIGSNKGYIYIRDEYRLSIRRLQNAIEKAQQSGYLGLNILGSGFDFDLEINIGAGSYVCGEETALFESLEGKRGEPRIKPPYPTESGLFGKPTVINNVETLVNIPLIVNRGADWFKEIGTECSPGTKIFTLSGDVARPGAIELPLGTTLRELIYEVAGGISSEEKLKMIQLGGAAGHCLSPDYLDISLDFDSLAVKGLSLGSGAILVLDESRSIIKTAYSLAKFFCHESCGQCTPCREGTLQQKEILGRILSKKSSEKDLELLERLSVSMVQTSLCPLGQTASLGISSAIKHFKEEFLSYSERGI